MRWLGGLTDKVRMSGIDSCTVILKIKDDAYKPIHVKQIFSIGIGLDV